MEIVAFDTDDLADGSGKAKITWISKTLLPTAHRMNPHLSGSSGAYEAGTGAIGGWSLCEMCSYLKNDIKPLILSDVRAQIKEVTKYTSIINTSGTFVANSISTDDIWLPSRREIYKNYTAESNGVTYDSKFTDSASRIKKSGSVAKKYWLRSAINGDARYFQTVENGGFSGSVISNDSTSVYICFGFCT